jgi:6-pyruvoyltetrahydropterin/6-carboxytetrahydropterin synthase
MYRVTKNIDFCYGHRLTEYDGKCRHLHGHNGRVEIEISGEALDARGMLTDFGDIKRLVKHWIDEHLDHRMIMKKDDPLAALLIAQGEPVFLIDENPTAEAIARLIYVKSHELGLLVSRVRLWETADSFALYEEG